MYFTKATKILYIYFIFIVLFWAVNFFKLIESTEMNEHL